MKTIMTLKFALAFIGPIKAAILVTDGIIIIS